MRRWLVLTLLALPALAACAQDADPLAVGKSLPGTFHAYNVNVTVPPPDTGETEKEEKVRLKQTPYSTKFKYHCLISEYDLDPTVMILTRGTEASEPLRDLLRQLDKSIEANRRAVRLRAFVVFVQNDLNSLTEDDDKRDEAAKKLESLAEDLKLRNVVVALAAKPDLEKYKLQDGAAVTAVLYKKFKVLSVHRFAADKVDDAAVKAVMADLKGKLGAKK